MSDKNKEFNCSEAKRLIVKLAASEIIRAIQIAGLPAHTMTVCALRLAAHMMNDTEYTTGPDKLNEAERTRMNEKLNQEIDFIIADVDSSRSFNTNHDGIIGKEINE